MTTTPPISQLFDLIDDFEARICSLELQYLNLITAIQIMCDDNSTPEFDQLERDCKGVNS